LTTLHVAPFLLEQVAALRVLARNDTPATLVAVSHALARAYQEVTAVTEVIHNGVSVPELAPGERTEDLLFIGRIAPEKGADLAIAVAHAAGRRLRLIGRIEDQVFYQRRIAPAVDGEQVVYLGHLPQREVWSAMARAAALLFTPRWPEACSLAVLEGMALGTPAIAFAVGGLVEQIIDGQTGFLVPNGDLAGAAAAVGRLSRVSAESCRAHIRQHFSQSAMVGAYEAFYRERLVK
ncbi:MAG: glycosyltransferase, partial [Chloroflexota bacterium]